MSHAVHTAPSPHTADEAGPTPSLDGARPDARCAVHGHPGRQRRERRATKYRRGPECRSSDFQWTVSAYVFLSGGLLLFGGRLSDLFDRRRIFLTGLIVFTGARW